MDESELFVGFESGAIGLFRLGLGASMADGTPGKLTHIKLFTAQKLIQDPNVRHILSLGVAHTQPDTEVDFIISIGYYSQIFQTIQFVQGFDRNQYTMVD